MKPEYPIQPAASEAAAERIRASIAQLGPNNPIRAALGALIPAALGVASGTAGGGVSGVLSALGSVAGALGTWVGTLQNQVLQKRFEDILWLITEEVARISLLPGVARSDTQWAEFVVRLLPSVIQEANEGKRRRYSLLLARGVRRESDQVLEEGRTMAHILDQLEYQHVEILDRLLALPSSDGPSGILGTTRILTLDSANLSYQDDGILVLRLQTVGLLVVEDTATQSRLSRNKQIVVNALGLRLHSWIKESAG